ncbi:Cwf15/Cwc15 cell cycle control protein [Ramaria rubella]|nr:Cwf15/Cwc15 cell cycle control protein [Ramaria rubella]
MSTAHRPTWDPAQAKEVKGGSRQYSSRDMAAHTKLKFRQPGQTSTSEVAKRDLRAELIAAEQEARDRKRKAEGLPSVSVGTIENGVSGDEETNKRRKLIQEMVALDKDDDDDDDDDANANGEKDKDDDASDEDEDDDEDDTAELLRELEKIKRERAEEKARQEREQSASATKARDAEIATSNPLLNLQAALGQTPGGSSTTSGSFTVKRRWDDDLIFKNQATSEKPSGHFVNDLLRTEFHKRFMSKFIKVS